MNFNFLKRIFTIECLHKNRFYKIYIIFIRLLFYFIFKIFLNIILKRFNIKKITLKSLII